MMKSRVQKCILNARVNLIFYVLSLILAFFSRKIFLECLGADFIGLTGTLHNLLGFLNLAELGIGSAIGYVLYKPLFNDDHQQINEIITVFGYLYRWVGCIILSGGILLACFLPFIFPDSGFEFGVIYAGYFAFLASSLIGYFVNYKQTILGADQRNYVVVAYFQTCILIKNLIQMVSAWYTGSYYVWVVIELSVGIIYSFILNWRIRVTYPWLKAELKRGRELLKRYSVIWTKSRQMFVHVLAGAVRFQVLPFMIYTFTSLGVVAMYGNYTMISGKISQLFASALNSTGAGVGHLIAEGTTSKILSVFWELTTLRYLIAGLITYDLYQLIDPFIVLWLGKEYILDHTILVVMMLNLFIGFTRGTNEQFNYGYGLFHDTWAPIVTLLITFAVALVLGKLYGLVGVLLGDAASALTIICIWKPYLLFSQGIRKPVYTYWLGIARIMLALILAWFFADLAVSFFPAECDSYMSWCVSGFYHTCSYMFFVLAFMFILNHNSMIQLSQRLVHRYA